MSASSEVGDEPGLSSSWQSIRNLNYSILEQQQNPAVESSDESREDGRRDDCPVSNSLHIESDLKSFDAESLQGLESEMEDSFIQDEFDHEPPLCFSGLRSELFDDFSLDGSEMLDPEVELEEEIEEIKVERVLPTGRGAVVDTVRNVALFAFTLLMGGTTLYGLAFFNFIDFLEIPSLPAVIIEESFIETVGEIFNSTVEETNIPLGLGEGISFEFIMLSIIALLSLSYILPTAKTSHSVTNSQLPDSTALPPFNLSLESGIKFYHLLNLSSAKYHLSHALISAETDTEKASVHYWLGRIEFRNRNYNLALNYFENSIGFIDDPLTRDYIGRTLYKLKDYDRAVIQLKLAIKEKESASSFEFLGKSLHRLKLYSESSIALDKSLSLNQNPYRVLAFLGYQNYSLGKVVQAKQQFERALELRCDLKECWLGLGYIAVEALDSNAAIYFRKAIDMREEEGDEDLVELAKGLIGVSPYLNLYFSLKDSLARIAVLEEAFSIYRTESLLSILLAINLRKSLSRKFRNQGITTLLSIDTSLRPLKVLILYGLGRVGEAKSIQEGLEEKEKRGNYRFVLAGIEECKGLAVVNA